jgi:hypothetical protein
MRIHVKINYYRYDRNDKPIPAGTGWADLGNHRGEKSKILANLKRRYSPNDPWPGKNGAIGFLDYRSVKIS